VELRIPPQKSNSKAAQAEREMKVILDLARQGKTASQIAEEAGCSRGRVVQVVKSFREYGAKLAPEPKKNRTDKRKITMWTDDMVEQLIALHREGLTFTQIGERMGISKSSVAGKIRVLIEAGVLKSRVEEIAWPAEDIELMMQLRAQGRTWGDIADRLGRKITACHNAYGRERERREKCQKG
jgi:DNA-binding MarR family transcriptional regulator